MIKRVIDISKRSYLHILNSQLIIEQQQEIIASIPVEDIGVLILDHPAITLTTQVIVLCQENKIIIVYTNRQHLPCGITMPIFEGNSLHSRYIKKQTTISQGTKCKIWRDIIKQKITQQAITLEKFSIQAELLRKMVSQVNSGDKSNIEAQAAIHYWKKLIPQPFTRDPHQEGINALLNYGYAILRASIARAICGAGLHPTIGIFHRSQYNDFCLADDLMEPFRPWVDFLVVEYCQQLSRNLSVEINQKFKKVILQLPALQVSYKNRSLPLMTTLNLLMVDYRNAIEKYHLIHYPQWTKQREIIQLKRPLEA